MEACGLEPMVFGVLSGMGEMYEVDDGAQRY